MDDYIIGVTPYNSIKENCIDRSTLYLYTSTNKVLIVHDSTIDDLRRVTSLDVGPSYYAKCPDGINIHFSWTCVVVRDDHILHKCILWTNLNGIAIIVSTNDQISKDIITLRIVKIYGTTFTTCNGKTLQSDRSGSIVTLLWNHDLSKSSAIDYCLFWT